jgi:hypothetical protein
MIRKAHATLGIPAEVLIQPSRMPVRVKSGAKSGLKRASA